MNALRYAFLLEQIPLLYAVMLVASLLAALVFHETAPTVLVTAVPAGLAIVTGVRAFKWVRMKEVELTPRQVELQLTITTYLGPVMAFAFTIWAAALFDYGNEFQQALVGMLVVSCLTLTAIILSILPRASMTAVAVACIPFSIKFISSGNVLLISMLLAFCAISILLLQVLRRYSTSFSNLIASQNQLAEQNHEVVQAKRALVRMAYRDELSGLANQAKFNRKLNFMVEKSDSRKKRIYIGIIDLDGFKTINNAYGYQIGDRVLQEVARRLETMMRGHGVVARIDGDEFAFILNDAHTDDEALNAAQRLCLMLEAPYTIDDHHALLTASCGMSCFPDNGLDAETLTSRAQYALQDAKSGTHGPVSIFTQWHESRIQRLSKIEQALRHAIAREELTSVFQPITDLKSGDIVTCEALARWHDPELGVVRPDEFIAIAEQSGLISQLTYLLLKNAATAAKEWPEHVSLSFNVSAKEITNPTAGLRILAILNEVGLDPRRFEVEITETAFLENFEAANATLRGLRSAGISVALDDFGTGQSGLQYVERIEFDKLKIDRAFVSTVESSKKTQHIVEAIADMCSRLKIKTVAEGIEETEQADIMRDLGCEYGQGYLFYKPLKQNQVMEHLWDKDDSTKTA